MQFQWLLLPGLLVLLITVFASVVLTCPVPTSPIQLPKLTLLMVKVIDFSCCPAAVMCFRRGRLALSWVSVLKGAKGKKTFTQWIPRYHPASAISLNGKN